MTNNAILPITVQDAANRRSRQNIKIWSMIVLVVQNTALVLMLSASRTTTGPLYSATSCVFLCEAVKVLMCMVIIFIQKEYSSRAFISTMHTSLLGSPKDTLKMFIPAGIYAIQNNLLFIALSNLDAASYQVTYQLKILTTAMFSVTMMGKDLVKKQWFALLLLMAGVTLVQLELQSRAVKAAATTDAGDGDAVAKPIENDMPEMSPFKGLVAVLMACFSSGFASVYFEKMVKTADANIWIRNIQLGIFGMLFTFVGMLMKDGAYIFEHGMFYGYNWLVIGVVLMQAAGGLLVAVVVKYADSILKGFATSISIVVSSIVQFYITGSLPSLQFMSGTGVVLGAVYLYS